jgi:LytS/YehU family sensor histidine kinase
MRLILENSRYQEVPLEKDLKALELYIQLESLRMNNSFTYSIHVDKSVDPEVTLIPPLILQPFVENAIWHGLQHKKGNGMIRIEIIKIDNMISCIVEDNGIGRSKALEIKPAKKSQGESLGIKITDARIEIINRLKKTSATVKLADLNEGVRVEVMLPLELSF